MIWIDAHSHWSDLRLWEHPERDALLAEARAQNIEFTLLGGVDVADWDRQLELQKQYPGFFGACFGLHPYKVKDFSIDECEQILDQLALKLPQAMAVGETGLDRREEYWNGFENLQIEMFENQIQLAEAFDKPLVLHIVKAHPEALRVLDMWAKRPMKGLVHAFNGPYEIARQYVDLGLKISVGGALVSERHQDLRETVQKLPLESLLIESDSPDQKPKGWARSVNDSTSVVLVGQHIAALKQIPLEKVAEQTTRQFKSLFSV